MTYRVGMAVGSWAKGMPEADQMRTLAADLDVASAQAAEMNLWVGGVEFAETLKAVARQLYEVAGARAEDSSLGSVRKWTIGEPEKALVEVAKVCEHNLTIADGCGECLRLHGEWRKFEPIVPLDAEVKP
jgi:hypothetical protein